MCVVPLVSVYIYFARLQRFTRWLLLSAHVRREVFVLRLSAVSSSAHVHSEPSVVVAASGAAYYLDVELAHSDSLSLLCMPVLPSQSLRLHSFTHAAPKSRKTRHCRQCSTARHRRGALLFFFRGFPPFIFAACIRRDLHKKERETNR